MDGWTPVTQAMPPRDPVHGDYGAWRNSVLVVATDGKVVRIAHVQYWDEDDTYQEPVVWKIEGRDGYTFDSVTHWRSLPPLPSA